MGILKQRRKPTSQLKTERVTVQVSEVEKKRIERLASMQGLGVSDYIRVNCLYKPWATLFGGDDNGIYINDVR